MVKEFYEYFRTSILLYFVLFLVVAKLGMCQTISKMALLRGEFFSLEISHIGYQQKNWEVYGENLFLIYHTDKMPPPPPSKIEVAKCFQGSKWLCHIWNFLGAFWGYNFPHFIIWPPVFQEKYSPPRKAIFQMFWQKKQF